ncbi:hypothetical protein OnM2_036084 [Erysiphe neolycopersici]|uniref:Uncharacterized protein n=1 Tax=Erysiphe neolycopersici TaxID=212602 RepID=A0A420HXB7_9PEZI|nr:hypothetical protein OnM2_036084 [Erysiphe neolycopersici]
MTTIMAFLIEGQQYDDAMNEHTHQRKAKNEVGNNNYDYEANKGEQKPEAKQEAIQILPFLTLSPFAISALPTPESKKPVAGKAFETIVKSSATPTLIK